MVRSVVAVLLGTLLGVTTIAIVESIGDCLVPTPEGWSIEEPDALSQLLPAHFLSVLVAWALGTFLGAFLASYFSTHKQVVHGLAVGGLLMAGGVFTMAQLPHPLWFNVIGVMLFLPAAWAGAKAQSLPLPGSHEGWIVDNEAR